MDVWIKRILIVAVIVIAWKVVLPRFQKADLGSLSSTTKTSGADNSCVRAAEQASETWGSGLRQFMNPPYDLDAWSSFRGRVDAKIDAANSACSCSAASCDAVKSAMRDLRSLVSDFDSAIRSGGSLPGDVVQRQEAIDNQITSAGDLVRSGK
jgi:hypothetical protein